MHISQMLLASISSVNSSEFCFRQIGVCKVNMSKDGKDVC